MNALDDAIVYKVNGAQKSKSGRAFVLLPFPCGGTAVKRNTTPISARRILPGIPEKRLRSNIPEEPVKFTDLGSEAEGGRLVPNRFRNESSRTYISSRWTSCCWVFAWYERRYASDD